MKSNSNFWSNFPNTNYKKGKILISPNDQLEKVYYLVKGNVKMFTLSPDGEKAVIHIFKKGSFFPVNLVLGNIPNKYYFEALTNIKVKEVSAQKVVKILKKDNKMLMELTKRLARGIDGLAMRLSEQFGKNVQKRLQTLLNYLGDRFGSKSKEGKKIRISTTHHDLAEWLGVSRETITREMKNLSKSGYIKYRYKQITLLRKNQV